MKGLPAPERLVALSALAAEINGRGAPPEISDPVLVDEHGWVLLPVPHFDAPLVVDARLTEAKRMVRHVWTDLHAGLTLQWQPLPEKDGLLLAFRGGEPDGDLDRDLVEVFLTTRGLRGLIADLQAIDARLKGKVDG